MNRRVLSALAGTVVLAVMLSFGSPSRTQEVPGVQPQGTDAQMRGPIHEGFAQPDNPNPQQGAAVPQQPPAQIEELPPDQRPEGANVQWLPGYWAYDGDAKDFVWISGCWRAAPPGRRWLPGHWQNTDRGWIFVSGFWAPEALQQVQYLPAPPPTLDQGPSTPAPSVDHFYAPGVWVYRDTRYFWRPGHWVVFQPRWVWRPAHYVWTPTGCLYIEDYWDYPLEECGLHFAPCRFNLGVWLGFRRPYIPQFVVSVDFMLGALFIPPGHRHYYFGDYFEPRFAQRGFVAWTDYRPVPGAFDPLFGYYRHVHVADPKWEVGLRDLYRGRIGGEVPRPPHTLVEQVNALRTINANKTGGVFVQKNIGITHVQNVTGLVAIRDVNNAKFSGLGSLSLGKAPAVAPHVVKLEAVSKQEVVNQQKVATQMREAGVVRRDSEAKLLVQGGAPIKHTDPPKTVKMDLPKAPVATKTTVAMRKPPAVVALPKHEDRPIPKYEPVHPPGPPKGEKKF